MTTKNLSGNQKLIDISLELYPYALKFYGEKYKEIIESTLANTELYQWNGIDFKNFLKEELNLSATNVSNDQTKNNLYGVHIQNFNRPKKNSIIIRESSYMTTKHLLAHELYGHAVCSEYSPIVLHNDFPHERNGIHLTNFINKEQLNIFSNEGIIEFIALNIMNLVDKYYIGKKYYINEVDVASVLFSCIGKDKLLDLLVKNNGNIETLFDDKNSDSWQIFSRKLDTINYNIDKELTLFKNRYRN